MALHDFGEEVPVFFLRKRLNGLDGRQGLEAKLGAETEIVVQVLTEGQLAMPYIPVMGISPVVIVWLVKASA